MPKPLLLFAPGAGAPSTSAWMQRYAERLRAFAKVTLLDYPYQLAGKKAPDPLPKLIAAHGAALHEARKGHRGKVMLIGKSMGGRVGCHLALEAKVDALVCLGYPLKGMGQNAKLRDEVLRKLDTPILFVQGTRDNLCPLDLLADVRKKMTATNQLLIVDGGNHSLEVPKQQLKTSGLEQSDIEQRVCDRVAAFVASVE